MAEKLNWRLEFKKYLQHGTPDQSARSAMWLAAAGLQDVDALEPSEPMLRIALECIRDDLDLNKAEKKILSYYRWHRCRTEDERELYEADLVSLHIVKILSDPYFEFSPRMLLWIHQNLFAGIYDFAGKIRTYDISKREWALNGDTVSYSPCESIADRINYLFYQESQSSYAGSTAQDLIEHIAGFTSYLWITHPYGEGNTRSTSIFLIKYLAWLGYRTDITVYADNSWFFRNALVRANYSNAEGVQPDYSFLYAFLSNLLLGTDYPLRNRELHLPVPEET